MKGRREFMKRKKNLRRKNGKIMKDWTWKKGE